MSTQLSTENRKQPPSIYTVMLFLAMIFLLIAVVAMFIELGRWYPELYNTQSAMPTGMMTLFSL
ncbi:hypothetical protein Pla22_27500 [Rubripirellula amarantea]|uniref:Uncharacterized protein n=1 Tax=Rubripirellula amarantea TaxID=2527999 RepID=A0A5C5WWL3_9BACT|nr:hypothetical protein [Rubripirellula amarantea]TWT55096.1 hypothetical protein Pla22_27500 [Rubripirellula amarantea]